MEVCVHVQSDSSAKGSPYSLTKCLNNFLRDLNFVDVNINMHNAYLYPVPTTLLG